MWLHASDLNLPAAWYPRLAYWRPADIAQDLLHLYCTYTPLIALRQDEFAPVQGMCSSLWWSRVTFKLVRRCEILTMRARDLHRELAGDAIKLGPQ